MKIAIVLPGTLPMPPVKGGAVENLINNLIKQNEISKNVNFYIFSRFDDKAIDESKKIYNSHFIFFKIPNFINYIDKIVFWVVKNILNKKNSQSYRNIFTRLYYLKKVSDNLACNSYDKVVIENHPSICLALKWNNNYKKYKGKYYYHAHNDIPSFYGCYDIIKNSEKIICVSKYIAKLYQEKLSLTDSNVVVLRNCVDEKIFSKSLSLTDKNELIDKYNLKKEDKVILFVGRIIPEKGLKELIFSLKNINYKNFKLFIIGSSLFNSGIKTKFEEEIENLSIELQDKIIFSGYINYNDIYKLYKLADFAVLPSVWDDPAPLTVIECLISGLPIITTNSGGIPEYATNDSAIIIKRDENLILNLSKNIENLLNDSTKLVSMSKNCSVAANNLTIENYYNNFIDIVK